MLDDSREIEDHRPTKEEVENALEQHEEFYKGNPEYLETYYTEDTSLQNVEEMRKKLKQLNTALMSELKGGKYNTALALQSELKAAITEMSNIASNKDVVSLLEDSAEVLELQFNSLSEAVEILNISLSVIDEFVEKAVEYEKTINNTLKILGAQNSIFKTNIRGLRKAQSDLRVVEKKNTISKVTSRVNKERIDACLLLESSRFKNPNSMIFFNNLAKMQEKEIKRNK